MFPHTYWMGPYTDGSLRQANEAQAAAIYQRALRLARLSRTAFDRAKDYGEALLRSVQGAWRQAMPAPASAGR